MRLRTEWVVASLKKIDLGCGTNKKAGTLGIDCFAAPEVDYTLDLQRDRLPFADRSVDYVHSSHCLEHLSDPTHLFREVSRVCVDGARVELWTPYLWHNVGFIFGHINYYSEEIYQHMCVQHTAAWWESLQASWLLNELVYVVPGDVVVRLYRHHIPLNLAVRHFKNVVYEMGAMITVRHDYDDGPIAPRYSFALSREGDRHPLAPDPIDCDIEELNRAIAWFSGVEAIEPT